MNFRPCIDIHNGKVKQIVGSSLQDSNQSALNNFISEKEAADYAKLYEANNLKGGHIIILNKKGDSFYDEDLKMAVEALKAYPNGMQIGGGISDENAMFFIDNGASHVIVTSFVFKDGKINYDNLNKLINNVGKERVVLDLSCKKASDGLYHIVTDRWQNFSDEILNKDLFYILSEKCDEFLIHAADVEGKQNGVDKDVLKILADAVNSRPSLKITYAGGIHSYEDILLIKEEGRGLIDFTIGSSLDLFGGNLAFDKVINM